MIMSSPQVNDDDSVWSWCRHEALGYITQGDKYEDVLLNQSSGAISRLF